MRRSSPPCAMHVMVAPPSDGRAIPCRSAPGCLTAPQAPAACPDLLSSSRWPDNSPVHSKPPHAPAAWGSRWAQALSQSDHARMSALFLRLFALIHFSAFASFGVQALGLIGSDGILPLQEYVDAARVYFGARALWHLPFV